MKIREVLQKNFTDLITCQKNYIYGWAISFVLLYHLFCICTLPIMQFFFWGAVGVDLFMLLGGLTLGYSFEKRNIKDFYLRRLKRIVPLYLLFTITKTLLYYTVGEGLFSFTDFIFSITGLSYFGLGGILMEWYLFCLLLLYLSYPLLFIITKK